MDKLLTKYKKMDYENENFATYSTGTYNNHEYLIRNSIKKGVCYYIKLNDDDYFFEEDGSIDSEKNHYMISYSDDRIIGFSHKDFYEIHTWNPVKEQPHDIIIDIIDSIIKITKFEK